MKKETIFKLFSITFGLLVGCLLLEGGYRLYHYLTFHNLDDIEIGNRAAVHSPSEEKTLGQVIQLASQPAIIYELIPNSNYLFQGVPVQTNKDGFRDQAYPKLKNEKTTRIIGLGDSVMFGWGVEEDHCYLSQLEQQLNRDSTAAYEVINTAVPGYNTVMEMAVLTHKLELSEIDWVILNFVSNDYDLPNFIRQKPKYLGLKKSMVLRLFEDNKGFDKRLRNAPFDMENRRLERNPDEVPAEYRNHVGKEAVQEALRQLVDLSHRFDFKVIFLVHNPELSTPREIRQLINEYSNFTLLEMNTYWSKYQQQFPNANWKLSVTDWHPSEEYHGLISKALNEVIMNAEEERR